MTNDTTLTEHEREAAKFLERDFNQCFEQMRHYSGQIVDISKFAFTGSIVVAGGAVAFYKYGMEKGIDFRAPAALTLCLATLFGFMLLGLVVRNRVYFVLVTRYVNEHRRFFLKDKPLGFENQTRMYTNPALPPYFAWLSSQSLLIYMLALLNAVLLTVAVVLIGLEREWSVWWYVLPGVVLLPAQLLISICYLYKRDQKSASGALWGKE